MTAEALLDLIERDDGHPALLVPGTAATVSYAELHAAVDRVAGELAGVGIVPGDAVAMSFPNGPEMVIVFLAIIAAGAAAAPLNPAYTADEFRGYLLDLRPRAMILHGGAGEPARAVCEELGIRVLDATAQAPAAVTVADAEAAALPARDPDALPARDPDARALLLHTSGTTSRPKVVPLRQRNLASSARAVAATYALDGADVSHCVMPLFHVHGLVASTLATLSTGGTVLVPPRFSASAFWRDTVQHGATWYSAVPTIHAVLTSRAGDEPVPDHALRFARSCSSSLASPLQDQAEERLRIPLVQAYGMTEAAHQMASNPLPPAERRHSSVGLATGTQIAILNDEWRAMAAGEVGEVAVRGDSVVDGYLDNPEANATSFRDGWFRTGDLGSLSEDGYLTLEGRIKEMINRGGEKISPLEVEDALLRHPSVAEAVVYAREDPKYGEQVAAAVVAASPVTADELQAHCAASLASFKVPASIALLDAIPKGPTGKVQRRLMPDLVGQ
jgi:acyl-CoA synthetase (AMP-forming)/AMP-acid ligase II